jgi:hypothetical protein
MAENIKLGLIIGAVGAAKTIRELLEVRSAVKQIGETSQQAAELAAALGLTGSEAEKLKISAEDVNRILEGLADRLKLSPDQVVEVATAFESLKASGASAKKIQQELNEQYGLSKKQVDDLGKSLAQVKGGGFGGLLSQGQSFLGVLVKVAVAIGGVTLALKALEKFAPDVYANLAKKFESITGDAGQKAKAFTEAAKQKAAEVRQRVTTKDDGSSKNFGDYARDVGSGIKNAGEFAGSASKILLVVSALRGLTGASSQARGSLSSLATVGAGEGISALAFKFNNVVGALQSLLAAAKPAYDFLIGSNEELNAQILRSQANLAGATRVFQGNTEVTDPTEKIKATGPAISAALKQVEKDTQSLVGVTSQQVNQFFDATLQNAGRLVNQSKEFGDPIKSATALTKGFAASFKVLGLEAGQIQSEIRSVLTGEELDNSTLAKGLQITRQNIQEWRGQGVLVDELNKRLQVYVAANKIAANSIAGAGSNVKDIFERVGREAGKPLLDPLIDQLNKLFFFLADNEQEFISFFSGFTQGAVNTGGQIGTALQPVIERLVDIFQQAAPLAESLFSLIGTGATTAAQLLAPLQGELLAVIALTLEGLNSLAELVQLRQINDAADALDQLTQTSDAFSQSAIATGMSLKALNKIQADGGKLTDEQEARQRKLIASAKLQVVSIEEQIKALKDLNPISADNRQQRDAQVKSLEAVRAALVGSSGAIRIEGQELKTLGTSYEQLAKKSAEAKNAIANAQTNQEASKAAKDDIDLIQQKLALGGLSAKQAEDELNVIASNVKLEVDVRQKAADDIGKIRKDELQRQTQDLDAQLAEIQVAADAGKKPPVEAAQEISKIKKQQLDLQLQELTASLDREKAKIEEVSKAKKDALDLELNAKLSAIAKEEAAFFSGKGNEKNLDKLRAEADALESQAKAASEAASTASSPKLAELQTQQKKLTADRQKEEIDGEKRVQEARINEIEQANTKALAVVTLIETRKNTELSKLQADGTITAKEAETKKLENTQARIAAEIKAEQTKFAALQALTASNPAQAKKLEADRAASEQKIAGLQGQAAQNEIAIRKNAIDQITQASQEARQKGSLAEKERFAELAELEAQGKISKEQVEAEKGNLTEARIGKELALERELLAKLQALPKSEDRDKALLQSQIKIAEQRIALVESTARREEAIRKASFDRVEAASQKAIAKVEVASQERLIATQKMVNSGAITEAQASQQKSAIRADQLKTELSEAQKQQAELTRLAQGTSGKARENAEKSVMDARKKTNGLTLTLLESEKSAQDELAKAAAASAEKAKQAQIAAINSQIEAIEAETAAKNSQYDIELSNLAQLKQARANAVQVAEIAAQREAAATEIATKAIERQSELLKAKASLMQATTAAATSDKQIEVDRAKRAVDARRALDSQNISAQERVALERELSLLGTSSAESTISLLQKQYAIENQLATQKREALKAEQEQAQAQLELDLKRNQLAANRAIIEARIGELKAKAALADAIAGVQEQKAASDRAISAAQGSLRKAEAEQKPEAISQAQSSLQSAQAAAVIGEQQAQNAIALAQQQSSLASQNTKETIAQKTQAAEIETLTRKTLAVQQQSALKQFDAAEAARQNAQNLEAARTSAEGIASAMERAKAAQSSPANQASPAKLPGRRGGGSVSEGNAYVVGESEPEVFVPGVSGTILNQSQIARNMSAFQAAQSLSGIRPIWPSAISSRANQSGDADLLKEVTALKKAVLDRPVKIEIPATFGSPASDQWDQFLALQRSLGRGKI